MSKRFGLPALIAVLVLVLVPAALAARGGEPGGEPSSGCASPMLTGPTEARVGETYTVNGCGFAPGSLVPLEITEAGGCCLALNKVADADGNFSHTGNVWAAGSYRVRALAKRKGSNRWRVAATWSFQASA